MSAGGAEEGFGMTFEAPTGRTDPGPSRAEELAALRARLHRGLDRLEALVREQLRARPAPRPAAEELARVEEARVRLLEESERWEHQRRVQLEAIEHDRRLLAEAWERLERAQLEVAPAPPPPPVLPRAPEWAAPAPPPHEPRADAAGVVSQAVLRQFEALRRDVRRAQGRRLG